MALTAKQIKFVQSYLINNSAKQAALNAGVPEASAASYGWQLLKNPKILAEIESNRTKMREVITKESYISKAMGVFEGGEFVEEPSRVRGLELAGKALGYVGATDNKQIANTTNNVQINVSGKVDQSALWQATRKLLSDD